MTPVMDDMYADFLEMFAWLDNTTDNIAVVNHTVEFCSKQDVNQFGATFIPVFYYVIFLLSFFGNGLVIFIIFKYEKLTTVTNIFLLNLVFSNVLFASSLPFWATYYKSEWIFGVPLCKMVSSAYFIGFYSSILFLTLMTFDRYLAVVHAVTTGKWRTRAYAAASSVAVWCVSILASTKELVLKTVWEHMENGLMCDEHVNTKEKMLTWHLLTYYQQFVVFFLIPLVMVMYCYISITLRILSTRLQGKCRTIKLIFLIIATFFFCWTPYNVVILLRAIQLGSGDADCDTIRGLDYAQYVTRNIAYMYSCISPIFYTFVGKKFQSHFRRLLGKRIPCMKRHMSFSSQSTRSTSQKTPHSYYDY